MSVLRWLVAKDLLRFRADGKGAILTLATPMALAALLGSLFAPSERATEVALLVVDQDQSVKSARLVDAIDADEGLVVERVTEVEARDRLEKGRAAVALVLPKGAGLALSPAAMFGGEPLPVQLLHDPSRQVEANLAVGLVTKITMQEVGKGLSDPAELRSMFVGLKAGMEQKNDHGHPSLEERAWLMVFNQAISLADRRVAAADEAGPDGDNETESAGGGMRPPLDLNKVAVTAAGPNAGYNSYAHNFAGMLCMFLLFWGLDAGKELIIERDSGSLFRVRLAPLSTRQILLGRGISAWIVAMVMTAAVYGLGMAVFGVRVLGSWPGFLLVAMAQAVFVAGFALMLAGLCKTERQVSNVGVLPILIMSFMGGATMPSFVLPAWVQTAAPLLPTWWATEGLAAMTWRGLPFTASLAPAAALTLFGIGCGLIGARTYRTG
ncbi:MAG: ABC-2 type transport system permease protein [Myxococcota bacterium]|jgi:ABC-2 type transport system permease protein